MITPKPDTITQDILHRLAAALNEDGTPRHGRLRRECSGSYLKGGWHPCHTRPWNGVVGERSRQRSIAQGFEDACHGLGYVLPPEAEWTGVLMEMVPADVRVIRTKTLYYVEHLLESNDSEDAEFIWQTIGSGPTLNDALTAALEAQEPSG